MASSPNPPKKTSPVVWVAIVAAAVAVYLFTSSDSAPVTANATKKKPKSSTKAGGLYTEEDHLAKFASITNSPVDVFTPLIKKDIKLAELPPISKAGIPGNLTGGEANWFYTGLVELDGSRQALLENTTTGESVYVSPGEAWKAARIRTVDISSVVMAGPDGSIVNVPLLEYGAAPGVTAPPATVATAGGNQPLTLSNSNISGAIGAGAPGLSVRPVAGTATMTLPDGRTVQVPIDASNALAGTNDNSGQGGGGRRGRRNRNQGVNNVP